MRFVPINCVREGSVLAKTVFGMNGEILLRAGTELLDPYIKRMASLGIQGAYINDAISGDLDIANTLSDVVRVKAIQGVKSAFISAIKDNPRKAEQSAVVIKKAAQDIVDEILAQNSIIFNIVDIKVYDDYTFYHCVSVTTLAVILGMSLEYSREKLVKLAYAALLHDIGKVFIDTTIINKAGKLTDEEYEIVKKHPQDGYVYLRERYGMTEISARGVLEHHERYDGGGYPKHKAGETISEFGRIISVADVYDALVSDRSYRKGLFAAEAMEYLMGGSGRLFDTEMVKLFSRKVALFPVGTCVLLSNGSIALVMENFESYAQRPLVKVFMTDDRPVEPYLIDLCHDFNKLDLTVVATVNM